MCSVRSSADVGFILANGYSLLNWTTDMNEENGAIAVERTTLGDSWQRHASVGVGQISLSQNGFYDDEAAGIHAALIANLGQATLVSYGLAGNVAGRMMATLAGTIQVKYDRIAQAKNLHMAKTNYLGAATFERGRILHPHQAETAATGNTQATSVDKATVDGAAISIVSSSIANPTVITTLTPHGLISTDLVAIAGHTGSTPAVSGGYTATVTGLTTFTVPVNVTGGGTGGTVTKVTSAGANAVIHVSALTLGGYTNLAVTLTDSADNSTFADVAGGGFTVVTASPASQRLVIAGTVRRYVAVKWVFTGAGSGNTASFMVGVKRNA